MDKILKFLGRLSEKENKEVSQIIENITKNNLKDLDVKKLSGERNIFRVRKAKIRIIFTKTDNLIEIISVSSKNEKTYKNIIN